MVKSFERQYFRTQIEIIYNDNCFVRFGTWTYQGDSFDEIIRLSKVTLSGFRMGVKILRR